MLEADGGRAVQEEPSHQYPIACCCHVTDGSRGQSDMEVQVKQRYTTQMAPTDIQWHLVSVEGEHAVDVSTVWWAACFSSGCSDSGSSLLVQFYEQAHIHCSSLVVIADDKLFYSWESSTIKKCCALYTIVSTEAYVEGLSWAHFILLQL